MSRIALLAGVACAVLTPRLRLRAATARVVRQPWCRSEPCGGYAGAAKKDWKIYTTAGPVGLADLGWGFGNGLRLEIEGSYRSNGISGISSRRVNGLLMPLTNVEGNAATYAVMANALYDIPFRPFGLLQPYIGAGVGVGWLDLGNAHGNEPEIFRVQGNTVEAPSVTDFGTAAAFAYQAMAGVSVPLSFLPGLSASLEYRFLGTATANLPTTHTSTATGDLVNGILPSISTHHGFSVADNAILIGLRYDFGHAPAPTPAADRPAPSPVSRFYLVFFDWDKSNLTDRARQIVAEAAANSTKVSTRRSRSTATPTRRARRSTTWACRSAARIRWPPNW